MNLSSQAHGRPQVGGSQSEAHLGQKQEPLPKKITEAKKAWGCGLSGAVPTWQA
jgi:hypothetical protein